MFQLIEVYFIYISRLEIVDSFSEFLAIDGCCATRGCLHIGCGPMRLSLYLHCYVVHII